MFCVYTVCVVVEAYAWKCFHYDENFEGVNEVSQIDTMKNISNAEPRLFASIIANTYDTWLPSEYTQ